MTTKSHIISAREQRRAILEAFFRVDSTQRYAGVRSSELHRAYLQVALPKGLGHVGDRHFGNLLRALEAERRLTLRLVSAGKRGRYIVVHERGHAPQVAEQARSPA